MIRPLLKLRGLGLIAFTAFALQIPAHAELTIEITGAGANQIPLAIADFGGEAGSSRALTSVIRGDLERSGLFKMIDTSGVAMTEATAPQYGDWKLRGADALTPAASARPTADARKPASACTTSTSRRRSPAQRSSPRRRCCAPPAIASRTSSTKS